MKKVALVVAGSTRLGRDVVVGLAQAGFDIAFTWAKDEGPATDAAERVAALGRRAMVVRADMSDPAAVGDVLRRIDRTFGRLDLLVHGEGAAASLPAGSEVSARHPTPSPAAKDPLMILRAMAPLLRASNGTIVSIPDPSAFGPWVDPVDREARTAGLGAVTRVLARTMAPHVRVNAIAPAAPAHPPSPTGAGRARAGTLDAGPARDLVRTILFLAGSPFVTGEVITLGEPADPEG